MTWIGVGIRRRRGDAVLDVLYSTIVSDDAIIDGLKQAGVGGDGNGVPLTPDQYEACRGLAFLNLPASLPQGGYHTVDAIWMAVDDAMAPIESTEEAYFRLQLMSQRQVKPHGQNLTGIFNWLPNLAWTNEGPVPLDELDWYRSNALASGRTLQITHVDKFPYMVNYHVPKGVRIASAHCVRLGAYLSEGTTVMPSGFVNFNAGTLGEAMIEGRVSAGVVLGNATDVGGGASIMGTLSGGNEHVISVGAHCLLGANSGIGISLGDGCTVGAGVYVTAGKKVSVFDANHEPISVTGDRVLLGENVVKASALSGQANWLFLEDSQTGRLIARPNGRRVELNEVLHTN